MLVVKKKKKEKKQLKSMQFMHRQTACVEQLRSCGPHCNHLTIKQLKTKLFWDSALLVLLPLFFISLLDSVNINHQQFCGWSASGRQTLISRHLLPLWFHLLLVNTITMVTHPQTPRTQIRWQTSLNAANGNQSLRKNCRSECKV